MRMRPYKIMTHIIDMIGLTIQLAMTDVRPACNEIFEVWLHQCPACYACTCACFQAYFTCLQNRGRWSSRSATARRRSPAQARSGVSISRGQEKRNSASCSGGLARQKERTCSTSAMPIIAPTVVCVVETGRPKWHEKLSLRIHKCFFHANSKRVVGLTSKHGPLHYHRRYDQGAPEGSRNHDGQETVHQKVRRLGEDRHLCNAALDSVCGPRTSRQSPTDSHCLHRQAQRVATGGIYAHGTKKTCGSSPVTPAPNSTAPPNSQNAATMTACIANNTCSYST